MKYKASIKILGKKYTSEDSDLKKAVEGLKVGKVAKGVSVLEVSRGDKSKSVILPAPLTFRVFSGSGLVKEVSLKNLLLKFSSL